MPQKEESSLSWKTIRRECKENYDNLFRNSRYVASCPGVFFAAGEHSVLDGGLGTCFQTQSRVYVGLEPLNSTNEILLGEGKSDHRKYNPEKEAFEDINPGTTTELAALNRVLKNIKYLKRKTSRGFKVRTLHEVRPGAGCNWSGATATALAAAIMHFDGELNQKHIAEWQNTPGEMLALDKVFDKCHRSSWILESEFHRGQASGYGNFCSLINARGPICYYTAIRERKGSKYPLLIKDENIGLLWEIPYEGFRFEDKWEIDNKVLDQDIEIALIFTGQLKDTGHSIPSTRDPRTTEKARNSILKLWQDNGRSPCVLDETLFVNLCKEAKDGKDLRSHYFDSLAINGLEVFTALHTLLTGGMSPDSENSPLRDLATAMKKLQYLLNQLGLEWPEEKELEYQFYKFAQKLGISDCSAIKLTGGGRGGEMVCIMPRQDKIEQKLTELVNLLREQTNRDFNLDWLLSRDKFPDTGLCLHMEGSGEKTGTSAREVHKCSPNGKHTIERVYPSEMDRIRRECVYLDLDNDELLIKGKKVPVLPFGRVAITLALSNHGNIDSDAVVSVCDELHMGSSYTASELRFRTDKVNEAAEERGSSMHIDVIITKDHDRKYESSKDTGYRIVIRYNEDIYMAVPASPKLLTALKPYNGFLKK